MKKKVIFTLVVLGSVTLITLAFLTVLRVGTHQKNANKIKEKHLFKTIIPVNENHGDDKLKDAATFNEKAESPVSLQNMTDETKEQPETKTDVVSKLNVLLIECKKVLEDKERFQTIRQQILECASKEVEIFISLIEQEQDSDFRIELISILSDLKNPQALPYFQRQLYKAETDKMKSAFLDGLMNLPDPSSVYILSDLLSREQDSGTRVFMKSVLSRIDCPQATQELIKIYDTEQSEIEKGITLRMIISNGNNAAIDFLKQIALYGKDTGTRLTAIEGLEAIGDVSAIPVLENIIQKEPEKDLLISSAKEAIEKIKSR